MTRNTYPIEPAKAFPGAVADGDTDMQQDKILRYESTYSNMLKTWARYIPTGALNRSAGGMAAIARDQRGGGGEPVRFPVQRTGLQALSSIPAGSTCSCSRGIFAVGARTVHENAPNDHIL